MTLRHRMHRWSAARLHDPRGQGMMLVWTELPPPSWRRKRSHPMALRIRRLWALLPLHRRASDGLPRTLVASLGTDGGMDPRRTSLQDAPPHSAQPPCNLNMPEADPACPRVLTPACCSLPFAQTTLLSRAPRWRQEFCRSQHRATRSPQVSCFRGAVERGQTDKTPCDAPDPACGANYSI